MRGWQAAAMAAVLATAILSPVTGIAHANTVEASRLWLTVRQVSTDAADSLSTSRSVRLTCRPPGGTHPRAEHACAVLERAGGDFAEITPREGACTMRYRPVRLTAGGRWQGSTVTYDATFENRCHAVRATDAVFDF